MEIIEDMIINVLITSAGQRVSLVRAFKNEVIKYSEKNKVFTIDNNPILAPACHISDGYRQVPRVTEKGYIECLLKICEEWKINIVIPTIDTELKILSESKDLFKSSGINLLVSDVNFTNICRDKRLLDKFFKKRCINTPKIYNKGKYAFPLFIKPFDGSLSKDIFVVESSIEVKKEYLENKKLIFMEYIDHKYHDEYTVDCYYDKNNNIICIVPRHRLFVRAGEINKGVTRKNELIDFIKDKLNHIPGAIGCLTMQFFLNKETKNIIAIEINPRFGGGYPLSYLSGANFPKYIIDEYIYNKKLDYNENWEDNLLMLRYDDEVIIHNYNE